MPTAAHSGVGSARSPPWAVEGKVAAATPLAAYAMASPAASLMHSRTRNISPPPTLLRTTTRSLSPPTRSLSPSPSRRRDGLLPSPEPIPAGVQWSAAESASSPYKTPSERKYTVQDIVRKRVSGLNPACREAYLSDDEFARVLGVSRADFAALRPWKQRELKIRAGLF